jgi:DNA repair protein RadC
MTQTVNPKCEGVLWVKDRCGRYLPDRPVTTTELAQQLLAAIAAAKRDQPVFTSPDTVKAFLHSRLVAREHEVFAVMFMDTKHRLIKYAELFRGTIDGASVYPREVVKECLRHNAAAVIFAHNHPSGNPEPSGADRSLTRRLQDALTLIDVRVLDHIIVGDSECCSLSERGWM